MASGDGKLTFYSKVDINVVIQTVGMLIAAIAFIITIGNKVDSVNEKLSEHKSQSEIHLTVSQGEDYFVRRTEFEALKEQLNRIEEKLNK
jgi:hypothetical protein